MQTGDELLGVVKVATEESLIVTGASVQDMSPTWTGNDIMWVLMFVADVVQGDRLPTISGCE